MSAYEIKVSITPLCPSCGKESHSGGFVAESRAPQGVFDRDSPTERTDQRVFITPCNDCFVHRAAVAELIEAATQVSDASVKHYGNCMGLHLALTGIGGLNERLAVAVARVKGGAR